MFGVKKGTITLSVIARCFLGELCDHRLTSMDLLLCFLYENLSHVHVASEYRQYL